MGLKMFVKAQKKTFLSISIMGEVFVREMGAGGFEPPNANARGFTIPALWPLGYTPVYRMLGYSFEYPKATSRTQTEDLQITNQLLYQLS